MNKLINIRKSFCAFPKYIEFSYENQRRFRSSDVTCEGKNRCPVQKENTQNLPYLPVPSLETTLIKYMYSIEPFVTECELFNSNRIQKQFGKCDGRKYQNYLIDRARLSKNWLEEWYLQQKYLLNKQALPINSSPAIIFPPQKFADECDMVSYTAKLIMGAIKFRNLVFENKLPTDTWGKDPLDMSQYSKIFGTTRVPGSNADKLLFQPLSTHIILVYNNNFIKMEVMSACNVYLSYNQMVRQLTKAMELGKCTGTPVGILTADKRDRWALNRSIMQRVHDNDENLCHIERAMFVLCMDNSMPRCPDPVSPLKVACHEGLFGGGSNSNGANRWYDKTIQFFVGCDGYSGVIFEHSPTEPIPVCVMADCVLDYVEGDEWQREPFVNVWEEPRMLPFLVSDEIRLAIEEAAEYLDKHANNLRVEMLNYDRFAMDWCKSMKVSTDALIQIALQYGFYRLHDKSGAQHESVTTRKFFGGRSDSVRSCSCDVVHFVKAMCSNASNCEKVEAFRNAMKRHKIATYDAMNGYGIERHLFGLRMASKALEHPTPKLFRDVGYLRSSHMKIATRQSPMLHNNFMCYGPNAIDGYGVCYNPRAENINICITNFINHDTSSNKYVEAWRCSMKNIMEILNKSKGKREKCV